MIQGIQNVSFGNAKVVKNLAKRVAKAPETFVSASSNLSGTVNEKTATRSLRDAVFINDTNTMIGRIASMKAAKKNVPHEDIAISVAKNAAAKEAAAKEAAANKPQVSEFNFFG